MTYAIYTGLAICGTAVLVGCFLTILGVLFDVAGSGKHLLVALALAAIFAFVTATSWTEVAQLDHNTMKSAVSDEISGSTNILVVGSQTARFTKPNGQRCTATFAKNSTTRIDKVDCFAIN